jgi:UDP-N-acetylglucosamine transferase subunit ALG13
LILITVGTQLPFDRLVKALDEMAPNISVPMFAQIGKGEYKPSNFEWVETIAPLEMDGVFARTSLIVSHAGTGTVLAAKRFKKPIILFPRRAAFGEHRNDHQLATAGQLDGRPGIRVAYTEAQLGELIAQPPAEMTDAGTAAAPAAKLVDYLRSVIG